MDNLKRAWQMPGILTAAFLMSGCGGQSVAPGALPGEALRTRSTSPQASAGAEDIAQKVRSKSKIAGQAKKGRLLYVADLEANAVFVYTYPQLSGAGYLAGFGSVDGVCTDRQGYVWVLDTTDVEAWEFPHGATEPINVVQPGNGSGNPGVGTGCAVNPKNGDLAVAGAGPGLTVFRNGQSSHATYWDYSFFSFSYVGYDNSGNLYTDGRLQSSFGFGLASLQAGSSSLQDVSLSGGSVSSPGGIQWDGKYVDIAEGGSGTIYQTNGSAILGTITTNAVCQGQFYILGNHRRVIDPDLCSASTGIYAYPAGGAAIKTASGGQVLPASAAISVVTR